MAAAIGLAMLITIASQPESVPTLAAEAGVDPTDLQGAVNDTGLAPRAYLQMTGEIAPSPLPPIPPLWTALAQCESSGRWNTNTGNGYYGGLQEDLVFWRRYGGQAYAARPDLASPQAQVAVALRGAAVQGWGAWPVCSRRLRLR